MSLATIMNQLLVNNPNLINGNNNVASYMNHYISHTNNMINFANNSHTNNHTMGQGSIQSCINKIPLLNSNSPIVEQPENMGVMLYQHQLALIH